MLATMSRPSFVEVMDAIEGLGQSAAADLRDKERIVVTIPGEMRMADGSQMPVRLRDLSASGIGFFHYGVVKPGNVAIKLAVNTYYVDLKWCMHWEDDLYLSGGPILGVRRGQNRKALPTSAQQSDQQ